MMINNNNCVSFIIHVKRRNGQLLINAIWLIPWLLSQLMIVPVVLLMIPGFFDIVFKGNIILISASLFMVIWAIGWTYIGSRLLLGWLFNFKGNEIIILNDEFLVHEIKCYFIIIKRKYDINKIEKLAKNNTDLELSKNNIFRLQGAPNGKIQFNYKKRVILLGAGIPLGEENKYIDTISGYIKSGK